MKKEKIISEIGKEKKGTLCQQKIISLALKTRKPYTIDHIVIETFPYIYMHSDTKVSRAFLKVASNFRA